MLARLLLCAAFAFGAVTATATGSAMAQADFSKPNKRKKAKCQNMDDVIKKQAPCIPTK
ncbi:hypothetical protein [Rhodopseudomonas palustris]|jgi:hypothetical protein|uniref:hypothetical protein n=1 Tax=Rhodopseudomonas palustris TaxID=1076 RepID=UPI00031200F7|nr:hypothetical protein [Rhodopseudomonas palustris]